MARTTSTLPEDLSLLIDGGVEAGVFENKSDAVRNALRNYFEEHEGEQLAAVVYLYDREKISLGKAAQLAGVSRFEMPEILRDYGVEPKLGPEDTDDARDEIDTARRQF